MDRCPTCGGRLTVDYERGEVVCTQCGLVVSETVIEEWRPSGKKVTPLRLRLR
jgi:transcription initiation factor TFIIB